ncbi:MAG: type II toxin-antitoxin system VapB family antitoxin [Candidatus Sumerlaeaceae bacterium]|nr:type II toxin-antitoxin system VapB family antitoxin [Candidatus Sumerlaeaceae bacterium]
MKTTVHIPDALFNEARRVAQNEGTTLKALVEEGLRETIARRGRRGTFRLRDASFKGQGLHPEFEGASWDKIRDAAYEKHGA